MGCLSVLMLDAGSVPGMADCLVGCDWCYRGGDQGVNMGQCRVVGTAKGKVDASAS